MQRRNIRPSNKDPPGLILPLPVLSFLDPQDILSAQMTRRAGKSKRRRSPASSPSKQVALARVAAESVMEKGGANKERRKQRESSIPKPVIKVRPERVCKHEGGEHCLLQKISLSRSPFPSFLAISAIFYFFRCNILLFP